MNWTKQEFHAYVLLYAAQSDYEETPAEKALIISKVDQSTFEKIHTEIDQDNDFQRAQKIMAAIKKFNYTKSDTEALVKEVMDVFMADGKIDTLEENMLRALKKLF